MLRRARLPFNEMGSDQPHDASEGLTFLIRTDARYATNGFRKSLLSQLQDNVSRQSFNPRAQGDVEGSALEKAVMKSVHDAYEEWGASVLNSISAHVNYDLYDIGDSVCKRLNVEFHDSHSLSEKIAENADTFMKGLPAYDPDEPVVFVSLDEMFHECRSPWGEVSFSRLFSIKGDQQFGYTARPGKAAIADQISSLAESLEDLQGHYGHKVKFVLLEDNVRHAKMLNWVIDLMDQQGVFDHADLACISTCFCSASEPEREAIIHRGRSIPLVTAVQLNSKNFEVSTPRDLFFDGYVVEIEGEQTRLPGLFMDVEKLFKVQPDKVGKFSEEIRDASLRFCERIEREWNIQVPLGWFIGAKAVSHVTGFASNTPMSEILRNMDFSQPENHLARSASPDSKIKIAPN